MGYQTFHEVLDENQAEQEGVTMGDLQRIMSDIDFDDLTRLRAEEAARLSEPMQMTIPAEEHAAFKTIVGLLKKHGIKFVDVDLALFADIRDAKKFVIDGEIFERMRSITHDEIALIEEIRNGDATVIRPGDITVEDLSVGTKIPISHDDLFEERMSVYQQRQIEWSTKTFGPAPRTLGIIDHIRKELIEIEKSPYDMMEWIDVVILALDGYWRHGGDPRMVMILLDRKQQKNFARSWPDWRTLPDDTTAIEHDRAND